MIDLDMYYDLRSEAESCMSEKDYHEFAEFLKNLESIHDKKLLCWGLILGNMCYSSKVDEFLNYFEKDLNESKNN